MNCVANVRPWDMSSRGSRGWSSGGGGGGGDDDDDDDARLIIHDKKAAQTGVSHMYITEKSDE
jgi:hypothetical protein